MMWPRKKGRLTDFLEDWINTSDALLVLDFPDFQTLVNKALIVEREHKLVHDNKPVNNDQKCKFEPKKDGQPVQKARTWQQTHVDYKPNWHQNVNKTSTQVKNVVTSPVREESQRNNSCFNCGQTGHYARQCPKNGKPNAPFRPQVNHLEPYSVQRTIQWQFHHLSVDEAQEDSEVVIGMFPVNSIPAIILFDSEASHSFISRSCVAQNKFPYSILWKKYDGTIPGICAQKQSGLS